MPPLSPAPSHRGRHCAWAAGVRWVWWMGVVDGCRRDGATRWRWYVRGESQPARGREARRREGEVRPKVVALAALPVVVLLHLGGSLGRHCPPVRTEAEGNPDCRQCGTEGWHRGRRQWRVVHPYVCLCHHALDDCRRSAGGSGTTRCGVASGCGRRCRGGPPTGIIVLWHDICGGDDKWVAGDMGARVAVEERK